MKKLLLFIVTNVSFSMVAMHTLFNTKLPSNPTSQQNDRFYFDVKNDTDQTITVYCHKYRSQDKSDVLPAESYNIKAGWSAKFMIYDAIKYFVLSKNENRPSLSEYPINEFSYSNAYPISDPVRKNNNVLFVTNFSNNLDIVPELRVNQIFNK